MWGATECAADCHAKKPVSSRLVSSGLVLRIADALQTGEVTGPRVGHFSQLGEGAGLQEGIDGGHAVAAAAASMLCIRTRPVLCYAGIRSEL